VGDSHAFNAFVHDISERKHAQDLLQDKNRELEESIASERDAHAKLKETQTALVQSEKLAGLGQMVAGVAHEINNPLAFVSNNVAVLERDAAAMCEMLRLYANSDPLLAEQRPELAKQLRDLSERIDLAYTLSNVKELTARSREGLRRIQQIVMDLRDFARLDQAAVHDADLNAGIESTVNIITGLAKKKRITIERKLENIPLITCQPAKINQVVMNLLSNAIDACDEGGTVTIHTSTCDQKVNIEVADTGHGIDPAIRQRIFDPFFTTKPPGAGTGLGLSISYGIIQEHGGRIDLKSTPGEGATFVISLPIKKS
jgi:signal transduction histidine kinase